MSDDQGEFDVVEQEDLAASGAAAAAAVVAEPAGAKMARSATMDPAAAAAARRQQYASMRGSVAADYSNAESSIQAATRRKAVSETRGRTGRGIVLSRITNKANSLLFTTFYVTELFTPHPHDTEDSYVINTYKPIRTAATAKNTWVAVNGGEGDMGAYIRVKHGLTISLREPIGQGRHPDNIPPGAMIEFTALRWAIETFQQETTDKSGKIARWMFRFAASYVMTQQDPYDYLRSLRVNHASPQTAAQRFHELSQFTANASPAPEGWTGFWQPNLSLVAQVRNVSTVQEVDVAQGMRDFSVAISFVVEPEKMIQKRLDAGERFESGTFEPKINEGPDRSGFSFKAEKIPEYRCISGTSVAYELDRVQPVKFTVTCLDPSVSQLQHDVLVAAPLYSESVESFQFRKISQWVMFGPTMVRNAWGVCVGTVGKAIAGGHEEEGDVAPVQEIMLEYMDGVVACNLTFVPSLHRCIKSTGMLYDPTKLFDYFKALKQLEIDEDKDGRPIPNGNLKPRDLEKHTNERTSSLYDTFHRPGEQACCIESMPDINIKKTVDALKQGRCSLYLVKPWRYKTDAETGAITDGPDIDAINALPLPEREAAYNNAKWYEHVKGDVPDVMFVVTNGMPVAGVFGKRVGD